MGLLIFFLSGLTLLIIATPLLKREKLRLWALGVVFISSVIIAANSTYQSCADGWRSGSIGKQGACSWHGGVVTRLNEFGWTVLIISLIFLVCAYAVVSYRAKHEDTSSQISSDLTKSVTQNCPLCGSRMRKKQGRYGEFLGCSRFPSCKGTRNT